METGKSKHLNDYIYIRLGKSVKNKVKKIAEKDGSNMTIWIRQLIIREVSK